MKITLINPPSSYLENEFAYPSMGLMYLASALINDSFDVEIIDLTNKSEFDKLKSINSEFVGITCVTPNVPTIKNITSQIPPRCLKIVGGPHCTSYENKEQILKDTGCDIVVSGEGESIGKILENGVKKGQIISCGLQQIKNIPHPNRSIFNLHQYTPGGRRCAIIQTSRGCPYKCTFCSRVGGKKYRELPIDFIMSEIEQIVSMGFNEIAFGDDNITSNVNRLYSILKETSKYKINFRLNMDARHTEEDLFKYAKECGCVMISYGIESGSQKILDLMQKDTTIEKNLLAIQLTKKYNMLPRGYLIVNFPGENDNTIEETVSFMEKSKCTSWLVNNFCPLPGTDAFTNQEKYGIKWISPNWSEFYLIGKQGIAGKSFLTDHLTFERQEKYKNIILNKSCQNH